MERKQAKKAQELKWLGNSGNGEKETFKKFIN
jgi:hypothetical protein